MANLRRRPYSKPLPAGAEILTLKGKRCARFKDGDGRTVTAPLTKKGDRVRLLSAKYYGEYRDADGVLQCEPLSTDRTAAEQMLAERVRKAERVKACVLTRAEAEDHHTRPLTEHLDDYRQ